MPASPSARRRFASFVLALAVFGIQTAPVIATEITTDLWVYNDGDTVTVSGIDFGPEETVEIVTTDPVGFEVDRGAAQTNGAGAFTYQFVLTVTEPGIYDVVGTGLTSGLSASTQFDPAVFALTANAPAAVQYSDAVVFSGTVTCTKTTGGGNCPTTAVGMAGPLVEAMINFDPAGAPGPGYYTVASTTIASADCVIHSTTTTNGLKATCTWSITWQAGRTAAPALHSVPPGTYPMRFVASTGATGPSLPGGSVKDDSRSVTVNTENTSTEYLGDTSATEFTSLSLSADVDDLDGGVGAGNGVFSPDSNLTSTSAATNGVRYELWDGAACTGTSLAGPVYDDIDSAGGATGASLSLAAVSAGSSYLKTTYLGNPFYLSSTDCDTIAVASANTPPVLTVPASPVLAEATSPAGATVSFVVTATDAEDNPDPTPVCVPASGSLFGLGDTTVNCTVTDSGSLSDSDSFIVRVRDTTDPAVQISTAAAVAGSGWYNFVSSGSSGIQIDVDVDDAVGATSLSCTDDTGGGPVAVLGPLNPAGDSFVIGDGEHLIACAATDGSGNSGSDSDSFDVDQTAPSISASVSPPRPVSGWWNIASGAPTVTYTCGDSGSGLFSCSAAFTFGAGENQGDTGSATDNAGNSNSASVSDIDVDLTAPTVTAALDRPADAGTGWFNIATGAPTLEFTCSDALSGIFSCPANHLFGEGANQAFNDSGYDNAGNSTSAGITNVDVDLTAPTVTAALDRAADAGTGWFNIATGAPTLEFTCSDALSGTFSCPVDHLFGEGENQAFSDSGYDNAGNSSSAGVTNVDVDTVAPSISASLDRLPGITGWFNIATGAPLVTFTCSDLTSGLAPPGCPADHLFGDGEDQFFTETIYDNAGNSNSSGVTNVDVDTVAPTVSAALDRLPDEVTGWFNLATGAPVAEFTCSDATSGIFSCPADHLFGEGENQSHSDTAYDNAGNSASASVSNVDVDVTTPAVTVTPDRSPDMNGWYNHAITFDTNGTDGTSGIQGCDPDQTYSGPDGTGLTVIGSCMDNAGNVGNGTSATFKFDDTNPTASVTFPVNGGSYIESSWDAGCSTPAGDFCGTAADPLSSGTASGVDHTIASIKDESTDLWWNWTTSGFTSAVEDFTPVGGTAWNEAFAYANFPLSGDFTVHAVAVDVAGNTGGDSSTFTLNRYTLDYQQPLDDSILPTIIRNTGKYGRVIPVKVQVYKDGVLQTSSNFAPTDMFTIGVNHMTSCAAAATDGIEMYADAGAANGGTNQYRWADSQLIYNLDTKAPPQVQMVIGQCYRLDVYLNGVKLSYSRTAVFQPIK